MLLSLKLFSRLAILRLHQIKEESDTEGVTTYTTDTEGVAAYTTTNFMNTTNQDKERAVM